MWCLSVPSDVLGGQAIVCQAGVQQGDPLVPMLFSLWLHGAIKAVDGVPGHRQLGQLPALVPVRWQLAGTVAAVASAFESLRPALLDREMRCLRL